MKEGEKRKAVKNDERSRIRGYRPPTLYSYQVRQKIREERVKERSEKSEEEIVW